MLYLLGVYGLVVVVVFMPILLVYSIAGMFWLTLAVVRFLVQHMKTVFTAQTDFLSKVHFGMIRR